MDATFTAILPLSSKTIGTTATNAIDGRSLHAALGVGKDFATWMTDFIQRYGFVEHEDYELVLSPNLGNVFGAGSSEFGKVKKDYILSIDMAKELAMLQRNEMGRRIRKYFIACEKVLLTPKPETKLPFKLTPPAPEPVHHPLTVATNAVRGLQEHCEKLLATAGTYERAIDVLTKEGLGLHREVAEIQEALTMPASELSERIADIKKRSVTIRPPWALPR